MGSCHRSPRGGGVTGKCIDKDHDYAHDYLVRLHEVSG